MEEGANDVAVGGGNGGLAESHDLFIYLELSLNTRKVRAGIVFHGLDFCRHGLFGLNELQIGLAQLDHPGMELTMNNIKVHGDIIFHVLDFFHHGLIGPNDLLIGPNKLLIRLAETPLRPSKFSFEYLLLPVVAGRQPRLIEVPGGPEDRQHRLIEVPGGLEVPGGPEDRQHHLIEVPGGLEVPFCTKLLFVLLNIISFFSRRSLRTD